MRSISVLAVAATIGLLFAGITQANQDSGEPAPADGAATLDETRLTMGKWIETQQIIARERNDWQQGKGILVGRLDLLKNEISSLEEKIKQAESSVTESSKKRDELLAEDEVLKAAGAQLTEIVTRLEGEVRRLHASLPEPLQTKIDLLYKRIPDDPSTTRVTAAERFQNVLVILGEMNKANTEITVNYEVRTLAGGRPAEVKAVYLGLAQAYYVSAAGEAGIGRPGKDGWTWESSKSVANDVSKALEILQGKQTPAFVPLPVKIQ